MFGLRLVRVAGDSMAPDLPAGAFALFGPARAYRPGDIVLADHDRFGRSVMEVCATQERGVRLRGRNPASVSPQTIGHIRTNQLRGRLVWSSKPPEAIIAKS